MLYPLVVVLLSMILGRDILLRLRHFSFVMGVGLFIVKVGADAINVAVANSTIFHYEMKIFYLFQINSQPK